MNQETFRSNLLNCIEKILFESKEIETNKYSFVITPVVEENKKLNSTDDYMRLTVLNKTNLENRYFNIDGVVKIFSGLAPLYPLWIDVLIKEFKEDKLIIELKTSLRFRRPSILQNQETGHPPFKAILD